MFIALIEGTYKQIYGAGPRTLASIVRQRIAMDLKDWTIADKVSVEYGELIHVMSQIRRSLEVDMPAIIRMLMLRK